MIAFGTCSDKIDTMAFGHPGLKYFWSPHSSSKMLIPHIFLSLAKTFPSFGGPSRSVYILLFLSRNS